MKKYLSYKITGRINNYDISKLLDTQKIKSNHIDTYEIVEQLNKTSKEIQYKIKLRLGEAFLGEAKINVDLNFKVGSIEWIGYIDIIIDTLEIFATIESSMQFRDRIKSIVDDELHVYMNKLSNYKFQPSSNISQVLTEDLNKQNKKFDINQHVLNSFAYKRVKELLYLSLVLLGGGSLYSGYNIKSMQELANISEKEIRTIKEKSIQTIQKEENEFKVFLASDKISSTKVKFERIVDEINSYAKETKVKIQNDYNSYNKLQLNYKDKTNKLLEDLEKNQKKIDNSILKFEKVLKANKDNLNETINSLINHLKTVTRDIERIQTQLNSIKKPTKN